MVNASPEVLLTAISAMPYMQPSTDVRVETISAEPDLPSNLEVIKITTEVVLFITLISINLAMGCTLTMNDFRRQWNYPSGVILAMVSQFLTYPLLTFALNHLLEIPSSYAIGAILLVASPGSSVSNLFTYFVDGDVCMSVCSTTFSTLLSFGMLPALSYIYTRSWMSQSAVIPYTTIAITLLMIVGLVFLGMTLRAWKPKIASTIVTIGTAIGLVGYSACALFYMAIQTSVYHSTWNVYFLVLTLPIFGFIISYFTGYLFKQHPSRCRTIAIETTFQNVGIAVLTLTATVNSFDWSMCVVFPILYATASGLYGLLYVLVFRCLQESSKAGAGYASLEPEDDFENPWLLVETDMSFRY